jgi:integrase
MVDQFLATKAKAGLARTHVSRMRTILADALRHAERRGLVARNAGSLAVMPRTRPPAERRSLTPDEARALLQAAKGERLEGMVVLGLTVGLRPGELTGLLWADIDLDAKPPTIAVSGAMKRGPDGRVKRGQVKRSKDGRRTIALPPTAVEALKAHRKRQLEERLAAGSEWKEGGLVFPSQAGTPLDPSRVRRTFTRITKRAGITDATFPYLLRHTAVSLLLDGGASIEEVADLLGDDPRTRYRHYRHKVRPVADAATRMEALLAGGRTQTLRARSAQADRNPQAINSARPVKVLVRRVGAEGIEPPTSCASCMRSNRLSYAPWAGRRYHGPAVAGGADRSTLIGPWSLPSPPTCRARRPTA